MLGLRRSRALALAGCRHGERLCGMLWQRKCKCTAKVALLGGTTDIAALGGGGARDFGGKARHDVHQCSLALDSCKSSTTVPPNETPTS